MQIEKTDHPGLEIDEALPFQRAQWVAERVAWALGLGVLVLAAAGLFGGGPLSRRTAMAEDARTSVEFERFGRMRSPMDVRLRVRVLPSGPATVTVNRDYLDKVRIARIVPEPRMQTAAGSEVTWTFMQTTDDDAELLFRIEPEAAGSLRARFRLAGGAAVEIEQFIYP